MKNLTLLLLFALCGFVLAGRKTGNSGNKAGGNQENEQPVFDSESDVPSDHNPGNIYRVGYRYGDGSRITPMNNKRRSSFDDMLDSKKFKDTSFDGQLPKSNLVNSEHGTHRVDNQNGMIPANNGKPNRFNIQAQTGTNTVAQATIQDTIARPSVTRNSLRRSANKQRNVDVYDRSQSSGSSSGSSSENKKKPFGSRTSNTRDRSPSPPRRDTTDFGSYNSHTRGRSSSGRRGTSGSRRI